MCIRDRAEGGQRVGVRRGGGGHGGAAPSRRGDGRTASLRSARRAVPSTAARPSPAILGLELHDRRLPTAACRAAPAQSTAGASGCGSESQRRRCANGSSRSGGGTELETMHERAEVQRKRMARKTTGGTDAESR
eukprot:62051-Prymnesium_polylepis.1